jgi:flagellar basal body-associated protein FliL
MKVLSDKNIAFLRQHKKLLITAVIITVIVVLCVIVGVVMHNRQTNASGAIKSLAATPSKTEAPMIKYASTPTKEAPMIKYASTPAKK